MGGGGVDGSSGYVAVYARRPMGRAATDTVPADRTAPEGFAGVEKGNIEEEELQDLGRLNSGKSVKHWDTGGAKTAPPNYTVPRYGRNWHIGWRLEASQEIRITRYNPDTSAKGSSAMRAKMIFW